jgi:hypothetical protein
MTTVQVVAVVTGLMLTSAATIAGVLFGVWRMFAHYEARNDVAHRDLGMRIDGTNTRVDGVRTDLGGRIEDLSKDLGARIDGVSEDLGGRVDKMNARIDDVHVNFGTRIDGLNADVGKRVDGVNTRLDALYQPSVAREA